MEFNDFGLAEPIMKALASKNYVTPTPIQQKAIPALLEGKDLCGIAQTGTGKTAAFALPSLDYFARNPKVTPLKGCRMLVLAPTRELAAQIAQSFRDYGRFLKLSVETVFGGVPINKQIRVLAGGVDIVVATPGRLLDLIDQRALTIKDTEIFVLDEADQMMDMGFIQPLKRVAKMLPRERQNLFFSATMPKEIEALAAQFLNDPVKVSVAPQSTTAERVRQRAIFVNQAEKQALLHLMLKSEEIDRALIFTRTKHGADRVVRFLEGAGIDAFAIHGNKSQGQRTTALQAFRQGKVKLLVATDIAARGIDVSGVSHVINFEIPNVAEQYVHRIGRTARAGAEGIAISFVADDERPFLKAIEKTTRVKLEIEALPENFMEAVRNMPKPAAPKKGPSQSPQQQARRADGQRKYQDGQKQSRGTPDRAHRPDSEGGEKRPFRRRRSGGPVGAHKSAVQRTGAPRA
ncbi:ATP-dependent RNA helicase RhlE [Sphingobium xenophagum]|uniref:ATP-dependent RNA helicase RhlE n=1 Tax=Sphingobium xenophagum TaxID=121428 RepID=A0ABU1X0E9_SPHXE|nr:DEAD/DEAH box helicase [Sphingobium xenophagum]MDR7155053.1 ATP-dependent RNA helicase RhlE [Sphingobium xenophagum]